MRMHIELEDELVAKLDHEAGPRGRSKFVRNAIESALRRAERVRLFEQARGAISESGHEWDPDPAAWVRRQRRRDPRRVG